MYSDWLEGSPCKVESKGPILSSEPVTLLTNAHRGKLMSGYHNVAIDKSMENLTKAAS